MPITAYQSQVEVNGTASLIFEDATNEILYANHCDLSTSGTQTILSVYADPTTNKGMLRIGTRVSDFAIEWGIAQEFYNGAVKHIIPVRLSNTKFAIVFSLNSDDDGYIICGTTVGTVATLGSAVEFADATTCVTIGAELLDTDKVLIAYQNSTTNQRAVCVTFTGTVGTVGAAATINSTIDNATYFTYQQLAIHSTTLATVVYRVSATVTECVTLSISGTTITVNTAGKAAFGGTADIRYPAIGALSATAFALAYMDATDTNKGNSQIGTIATTTITAGASEYNYNSSNNATSMPSISVLSSTAFFITFSNTTNTDAFSISIFKVSGTVITLFAGIADMHNESNKVNFATKKANSVVKASKTSDNQVSMSYISKDNQFICAMLSYILQTVETGAIISGPIVKRAMCYKVAEAGAGEQIEISSIFGAAVCLNETIESLTSSGLFPNSPIILTANQKLYAMGSTKNSLIRKPKCTVFGLKRT